MIELQDEVWDGFGDVRDVIRSLHETPTHAVVERSVFAPRNLVEYTERRPIVNAVRAGTFKHIGRRERRTFVSPKDVEVEWGVEGAAAQKSGVYVDDNFCAHTAFNACFGATWVTGTFTHLAHIFDGPATKDPRFFTALPNLVLVPSWLSRLTDVDPEVRSSLRWIARRFYGFCTGDDCPKTRDGDGCKLCSAPGHKIEENVVEDSIARWERRAVDPKLYKPEEVTQDKRWRNALSACLGCSYTFYRPALGS